MRTNTNTGKSWCVITGAPSCGKSSTIRALNARGYQTLPEAARIVLDQRISEGDDPDEVRQEGDFHEQIESVDRDIETLLPTNDIAFLDRSLADNIAYRRHFGSEVPEALTDECVEFYDSVFVLERIPFKDDSVRSESDEEAEEIQTTLIETYEELGYEVTTVPVMPIDERCDTILSDVIQTPPIH